MPLPHHILTFGIFVFSIEPNSVDCIFVSAQKINAELYKIITASLALAHLTAVSFAVLVPCLYLNVFPFLLLSHSVA